MYTLHRIGHIQHPAGARFIYLLLFCSCGRQHPQAEAAAIPFFCGSPNYLQDLEQKGKEALTLKGLQRRRHFQWSQRLVLGHPLHRKVLNLKRSIDTVRQKLHTSWTL